MDSLIDVSMSRINDIINGNHPDANYCWYTSTYNIVVKRVTISIQIHIERQATQQNYCERKRPGTMNT